MKSVSEQPAVVKVTWVDSMSYDEWVDIEAIEKSAEQPPQMVTVGYILQWPDEGHDYYLLARTLDEDDGCEGCFRIPVLTVKKVDIL